MANQVEERRRDRRHLAPCCSPAAKLLMSRSGFQGHQLHLSSTTWDESPAAILARLLAKIMASEKTVQQLQTQPNFSRCVGPSCPVLVLAQSREMLPVSGPGRGQPFHCRCSPLLGDMQHLLWALLSFCFGDHLGATFYTDICSKSPGVGQKSCSTVLRCQHFLSGWFVVFFFSLCLVFKCHLLAPVLAEDARCPGAGHCLEDFQLHTVCRAPCLRVMSGLID